MIHSLALEYNFDIDSCPLRRADFVWLMADRMANLHYNEKIVIAAIMNVVYRLEKTINIQQLNRCRVVNWRTKGILIAWWSGNLD